MTTNKHLIAAIAAIALGLTASAQDVLTLKSGVVLTGKVVQCSASNTVIEVRLYGGSIVERQSFDAAKVANLERGSVAIVVTQAVRAASASNPVNDLRYRISDATAQRNVLAKNLAEANQQLQAARSELSGLVDIKKPVMREVVVSDGKYRENAFRQAGKSGHVVTRMEQVRDVNGNPAFTTTIHPRRPVLNQQITNLTQQIAEGNSQLSTIDGKIASLKSQLAAQEAVARQAEAAVKKQSPTPVVVENNTPPTTPALVTSNEGATPPPSQEPTVQSATESPVLQPEKAGLSGDKITYLIVILLVAYALWLCFRR